MRYLQSKSVFEHYLKLFESFDDVKKDIEEICYELTDGRFDIKTFGIRQAIQEANPQFYVDNQPKIPIEKLISTWKMSMNIPNLKVEDNILFISLSNHMDYDGFSFEEVREVVLRLMDYLGDKYKGCSALYVGEHERSNMPNSSNFFTKHDWIDNLTNLIIIYR